MLCTARLSPSFLRAFEKKKKNMQLVLLDLVWHDTTSTCIFLRIVFCHRNMYVFWGILALLDYNSLVIFPSMKNWVFKHDAKAKRLKISLFQKLERIVTGQFGRSDQNSATSLVTTMDYYKNWVKNGVKLVKLDKCLKLGKDFNEKNGLNSFFFLIKKFSFLFF